MRDITNQSSILNNGLIERKKDIIGESSKVSVEAYDEEMKLALKIQDEITEVFIKHNANMRTAYTVCVAMAESIAHYMMFGEK